MHASTHFSNPVPALNAFRFRNPQVAVAMLGLDPLDTPFGAIPYYAAHPAVVSFLQGSTLVFSAALSLALLRKLGGVPWINITPHVLIVLAVTAEVWRLNIM